MRRGGRAVARADDEHRAGAPRVREARRVGGGILDRVAAPVVVPGRDHDERAARDGDAKRRQLDPGRLRAAHAQVHDACAVFDGVDDARRDVDVRERAARRGRLHEEEPRVAAEAGDPEPFRPEPPASDATNVPCPSASETLEAPLATSYVRGRFAARSGAERSTPVSTTPIVIERARRSTASGTRSRPTAAYCHSYAPPGVDTRPGIRPGWRPGTAGRPGRAGVPPASASTAAAASTLPTIPAPGIPTRRRPFAPRKCRTLCPCRHGCRWSRRSSRSFAAIPPVRPERAARPAPSQPGSYGPLDASPFRWFTRPVDRIHTT